MIDLDLKTARTLLEEIVSEKGEHFVYDHAFKGCTYAREGQPSCLIGHLLFKLGVPITTLEELDFGGSVPADTALRYLREDGLVRCGEGVHYALRQAQIKQDDGYTWGAAVKLAFQDHGM